MKRINLLLTAVVFFGCISVLSAQDWPQFLGPNRNSTSPQKGILRSWPAGGPKFYGQQMSAPDMAALSLKKGKFIYSTGMIRQVIL